MGKNKQPNIVEKCDEWLSTRTKSKIQTPKQAVKRASLSKPLRNIGNIILTQTSTPPKELQTHTKQSTLSNYFTKSKFLTDVSNIEDDQFESSDELPVFLRNPSQGQFKENNFIVDGSLGSDNGMESESVGGCIESQDGDHHMDIGGDSQHSSDDLPHLTHRNSHSKKQRIIHKGRRKVSPRSVDSHVINNKGDNHNDIDMELPLLTMRRKNSNIVKQVLNNDNSAKKKSKDQNNRSEESSPLQNNANNKCLHSQSLTSTNTELNTNCYASDVLHVDGEDFLKERLHNKTVEKQTGCLACLRDKPHVSCNIDASIEIDSSISSDSVKGIVTGLTSPVNSDLCLMTEMSEPVRFKRSETVSSLNSDFDLMTESIHLNQKLKPVENMTYLDTELDLMSEVNEPINTKRKLEKVSSLNSGLDFDLMSEIKEPVKTKRGFESGSSCNSDLDLMSEVTEPVKKMKKLEAVSSFNSDLDMMSEVSGVECKNNLIGSQEADLELENFSLENDSQIDLQ